MKAKLFRNNTLVCCAVPLVAGLLFAAASQFAHAMPPTQPCILPVNSYAVLQSTLEYADVSASYASSVYDRVREILRRFLGFPEGCFFYDSGQEVDLTDHDPNTLLDLHCQVKRDSFKVLLSVQIDVHNTTECLLSFQTSAPFFQPADALYSFAISFPEAFAGEVVRNYSWDAPRHGFQSPSFPALGLSLGNAIDYWPTALGDLELDVGNTPGVPPKVMQSLRCFRTRRTIEASLAVLAGITFVGTLVPIALLGHETPDALLIAWGAGFVTFGCILVEVGIFPAREPIATLNDWCCADGEPR